MLCAAAVVAALGLLIAQGRARDSRRDSLSQRVAALAIHPILHTTDAAAHAFDTRNHRKVLLLVPALHTVFRRSQRDSQESGDLCGREPARFADFWTHHGRLQNSAALPRAVVKKAEVCLWLTKRELPCPQRGLGRAWPSEPLHGEKPLSTSFDTFFRRVLLQLLRFRSAE